MNLKQEYITSLKKYEKIALNYLEKDAKNSIECDMSEKSFLERLLAIQNAFIGASHFLSLNELNMQYFSTKNEQYLSNARKLVIRSLTYFEDITTNQLFLDHKEQIERLALIDKISIEVRLNLVKSLGFLIDWLSESYQNDARWHWPLIDLKGRFAVIVKNFVNLKTIYINLQPSEANYPHYMHYITIINNSFNAASELFRQRFEISSQNIYDFERAMHYLEVLKKIQELLRLKAQAEQTHKKLESWDNAFQNYKKKLLKKPLDS